MTVTGAWSPCISTHDLPHPVFSLQGEAVRMQLSGVSDCQPSSHKHTPGIESPSSRKNIRKKFNKAQKLPDNLTDKELVNMEQFHPLVPQCYLTPWITLAYLFWYLFSLLNPHSKSCPVPGSFSSVPHNVSCAPGQWPHSVGATPGPLDWGIAGTALAGARAGTRVSDCSFGVFCLLCASVCVWTKFTSLNLPVLTSWTSHPRPLRILQFCHPSALPKDLNLPVIFRVFLGF